MTNVLTAALAYIERGWAPVPVPFMSKGPIIKGWQDLRIATEEVSYYFNGDPQNVGVILGPASRGLADVDLDCPQALAVAPYFLPSTRMFGRPSTPAAHWLYVPSGAFSFAKAVLAFVDPAAAPGEKARLIELRVGGETGAQTVFPPSVHESGEEIRWENGGPGEPARIDSAELEACVHRVAAAALLARHWPAEGQRHDAALAIGGALRRAGWDTSQIKLFIEATVSAASREDNPKEYRDRLRAAVDAAAAVDKDERAYGLPKLAELVGDKVVHALVEWLGLDSVSSYPGEGAGEAPPAAAEAPWPVLEGAAFHGLPGDVVRVIAPHTEADPVAVLLQFLSAYGAACGRTSYAMAEADRHPPQVWPVLVGVSSRGRKGTSWGHVLALFEEAQPPGWVAEHFTSGGLSSGEGIIWAVRDPIRTRDKKSGNEEETDPGVKDKRLLVVEAEFASVLRQFERMGNTLSATLRNLWDRGAVRAITKNSPAKTTGAHVCVIGHITADELGRYLDRTELANGFANRLLFICVRRAQRLPFGASLKPEARAQLAATIRERLATVLQAGDRRVCLTLEARELWAAAYTDLTEDRPGIHGAVTARSEAQVLRLALIYALADEDLLGAEALIDVPHLEAALAVWKYCDASAARLFGKALGDPVADEIYRALRQAPGGMTRWDIANHFGRHRGASAIGRALALLLQRGLVRAETNPTGGRPEERWYAK